jgi:hypothetical protein
MRLSFTAFVVVYCIVGSHSHDEEREITTKYRINSGVVFNNMLHLCLDRTV